MADQLLFTNIPERVRSWTDAENQRNMAAMKEFVIRKLEKACKKKPEPRLFDEMASRPVPAPDIAPFTFIDLFAGIGGLRIALQRNGGKCLFSSEWDKNAQKTYAKWFGEMPEGDITKINPNDIPDHDVLAGGFPCQPFSIAGVSKKNSLGKAHGFKCLTQGTLFFNIINIAQIKRPPVLFLENVKNLRSHDKGRTWKVISQSLEEQNYWVFKGILDAADFGVPQHRERIFIVCFDKYRFPIKPPFEFPVGDAPRATLQDILEKSVDKRYTLTSHLWNYLQEYAKRHAAKGNGFGYGLAKPDGITRTLSARYYKDGSEILIPQKRKPPRRLTPRECARLMGYDREVARFLGFSEEELPIVVADTQAYRQFGNSVVPAVAEAVGREIVKILCWQSVRGGSYRVKGGIDGTKR